MKLFGGKQNQANRGREARRDVQNSGWNELGAMRRGEARATWDDLAKERYRGGARRGERERPSQESQYEQNLEKLRNVDVQGDGYIWRGEEFFLTKEALARCDLAPDCMMEIGGREIQLSKVFKVGSREAAIGYVKGDDGRMKARSYYRSNSQGVWRYLPDYTVGRDGDRVGWYGKGYDETMLTLPAEVQMALNYQSAMRPPAEIGKTDPEFLLVGTAKRYNSKSEYSRLMKTGQLRGDLYREARRTPKFLLGNTSYYKVAPEEVSVEKRLRPDFHKKTGEYRMMAALTGPTKAEVFSSYDKQLKWTMCTDRYGRSWVGGAEVNAPVTSTGVRSEWVELGDVATPLYEYGSMADGYGDTRDAKGSYVNMWKGYLSKMPLIREYVASKRR